MQNNNIIVDGKKIDVTSRDVDVMYLSSIEEYIGVTATDIEHLILFLSAELQMLNRAKDKYTKVYRALPYLSDTTPLLGDLLSDIEKKITSKQNKLNKYKGLQ